MARLILDWVWGVLTVWQEAQGESFEDKVMVAEVIQRRTARKYMSDGTVAGTVLWPMQFSGWNAHDDTPQYKERVESAKLDDVDPVVRECVRAWEVAANGSNLTNGALLYYNPKISSPPWAKKCTVVARGNVHVFLIEKGGKAA